MYVINTCSVTQNANRDCRKIVHRALSTNPDAFVAVTGCYAQLDPEEIAAIDGVDIVLGAKDKFNIFDLVDHFEKVDETVIHRSDVNDAADFHHAFSTNDRTRVFLKIQDGCDYKCTFCTIPLARGKSRSPRITQILDNARMVIDQGYKEIVLTGVNAGDFGKQHGETFFELLQELDKLDGMKRIRISSIEPNLLHNDIIRFAAESRCIQHHFHIPLQSGSDAMLKLMRRRYQSGLYRQRVELIREVMPDACIGVDVITGHPGETDELFQESFNFINSLPVSYLHVFTYSERPNTRAVTMDDVIPKKIRKKRTHKLRRLSRKKRFEFDGKFMGEIRPVLFETENQDGMMFGWTNNYLRVAIPWEPSLANEIIPCRLESYHTSGYFDGAPDPDTVTVTA